MLFIGKQVYTITLVHNSKFSIIGGAIPLGIMTVISYPIPAYSNVPIEPQFYQPSRFVITGITLGVTTIVTTSVDINYVIGQLCRLIIPPQYGCRQLNEVSGYVLSIPTSNSVELNIYSLGGDAFKTSTTPNQPQILAIGDINTGYISTTGVNIPLVSIPASFINISPN